MALRVLLRCVPIAAALACGLLAGPASGSATTVWLCGLSDDLTRIVCVADAEPAQADAAPRPTAQVRGTRFPLDPRRSWTVDLWSPATEPGPVTELARATLCYRSPACEVIVDTSALTRDLRLHALQRR